MIALNKINQTLYSTNHQLHSFSKELKQNPSNPLVVEKLTGDLHEAATKLEQEIKGHKISGVQKENLKSNLEIIGKLKTNESLNKEFKSALKSYESQLKILKKQHDISESTPKSEVKVKPIVRRDKDVGKHLTDVNAKLKALLTNKEKVSAQNFKDLTNILMKTNVALTKSVAFQKTLSNQYKPDYNARMIQTILNGINSIGSQSHIVQVSSQATIIANFQSTLAEAKGLLEQVLEHLKASRGKRVSKVRSDRAKK